MVDGEWDTMTDNDGVESTGGLGTTESPIYHRRRRKGTDGYSTISVFDEMRRGGTLSGDQDQATEAERQRQRDG